MSINKLTDLEAMILKAVNIRPDWLPCHRNYLGEVLALQCKGLVESRLLDGQLQVRRINPSTELR